MRQHSECCKRGNVQGTHQRAALSTIPALVHWIMVVNEVQAGVILRRGGGAALLQSHVSSVARHASATPLVLVSSFAGEMSCMRRRKEPEIGNAENAVRCRLDVAFRAPRRRRCFAGGSAVRVKAPRRQPVQ